MNNNQDQEQTVFTLAATRFLETVARRNGFDPEFLTHQDARKLHPFLQNADLPSYPELNDMGANVFATAKALCLSLRLSERTVTNRSPILTDTDHRAMDNFLDVLLEDYKQGDITKAQVMGGLAQVIGAVDSGNHAEAVNWFKQGRKLVRLAV